jgi:hypothetical protein
MHWPSDLVVMDLWLVKIEHDINCVSQGGVAKLTIRTAATRYFFMEEPPPMQPPVLKR